MSKKNDMLPNDEAIKNLLIIIARINGVKPAAIAAATGIAERTIENKFTLHLIKGGKSE